MENRIKEQLSLFADRVSAETMAAIQLRVYLAGMRYVLVSALRRIGLAGTEMARSQAVTIRSRLLKIGAQVKVTARRGWAHLSEAFPLQAVFWHAAARGERREGSGGRSNGRKGPFASNWSLATGLLG